MSANARQIRPAAAKATNGESMGHPRRRVIASALIAAFAVFAAFPGLARAHGPVAPVASSYLARVTSVPAAVDAKVVDGDQRMWLSVGGGRTIVVLDYLGAPYLRFSRSGVEVNQRSGMYYLNQTPAELPPAGLTRTTPPRWVGVTSGGAYSWHDGRLHALAAVALAPGATYVGRWRIPIVVDGQHGSISGGLWHQGDPSLVWFWPVVVLLACVLAGWRVRRRAVDVLMARVLSVAALTGVAVDGIGRELYGRPMVGAFQVVVAAAIAIFVAWGFSRALRQGLGYFSVFVIAFVTLWVGGLLVPTLLNGFVLMAIPAFLARAATVVCLGSGIALLLLVFRLADYSEDEEPAGEDSGRSEREGSGFSESFA